MIVVVWTLRLPYTKPPLSLNSRSHWRTVDRLRKQVHRDVVALCAAQHVPRGLDHITVQLVYVPRDKRIRDTDNLVATLKPICDALSQGSPRRPGWGIVPDDNPRHMAKPEPIITRPDPKNPHLYIVITPTNKETP